MFKWLLLICSFWNSAAAETLPRPLFSKLVGPAPATSEFALRPMKLSNLKPLTAEEIEFNLPANWDESSDLTKAFAPQLSDDLKNYMTLKRDFEDHLNRLGTPKEAAYPELSRAARDDLQSGLIRNYLENQLLENFLIKKLTTSSETIQSVNRTVKEAAAPNVTVTAPEQGTSLGTDTNLLKRRAKLWLTSPIIDGEAHIRAPKIINPEYSVRFSKTFDLQKAHIGIKNIHGEFNYQKDSMNSLFRTDFTSDLNFSYQREIRNRTDSFMFNFNQSF